MHERAGGEREDSSTRFEDRFRLWYLLGGILGSHVHRVACTVSTIALRKEFGAPGTPYRCARDFNVEAPTRDSHHKITLKKIAVSGRDEGQRYRTRKKLRRSFMSAKPRRAKLVQQGLDSTKRCQDG